VLELLTKSKIRKKIILLFIFNRDQQYYLSQIANLVSTSSGTAQRELNKLLDLELIHFEQKARSKFYSLNHEYSLLNEVESIVKKTNGYAHEN